MPKKTKINPEDRLYGKPFVPAIADDQPPRRDLYMGTLVNRIFEVANKRRQYDKSRYKYTHRFSWANLARSTGLTYRAVKHYFIERDRALDIPTLDKVLFGMKLSVLDLIDPIEIISYLQSLEPEELAPLRRSVKEMLDKLPQQAQNQEVSPSPSQNAQNGDGD